MGVLGCQKQIAQPHPLRKTIPPRTQPTTTGRFNLNSIFARARLNFNTAFEDLNPPLLA
jgi:hypothetical protein